MCKISIYNNNVALSRVKRDGENGAGSDSGGNKDLVSDQTPLRRYILYNKCCVQVLIRKSNIQEIQSSIQILYMSEDTPKIN